MPARPPPRIRRLGGPARGEQAGRALPGGPEQRRDVVFASGQPLGTAEVGDPSAGRPRPHSDDPSTVSARASVARALTRTAICLPCSAVAIASW
jgi:hypothetical protein